MEEQKWSGMQVTDLVLGGFQQSAKELSLTTLFSLNPSGISATGTCQEYNRWQD